MELKKKLVLAICSGNIVILAIFLWAWKMTQTDKEKLRMAKNLVKSNNKKIKKALELLDELSVLTGQDMHLLKEIKEILEKWH